MTTLSQPHAESARKNAAAILRGLSSVGQASVAKSLELSESAVSRMKSEGDIDRFAAMLALCGLKIVPATMQCYRPETLNALHTLAQERLNSIHQPSEELVWEDEP